MGIGRSELVLPGLVTPGNRGTPSGVQSILKGDSDFQKTAESARLSRTNNTANLGLEASAKQGVLGFYNRLGDNDGQQNFPVDGNARQALNAYITQKNQPKQDAQEKVSRLLGVDYYV